MKIYATENGILGLVLIDATLDDIIAQSEYSYSDWENGKSFILPVSVKKDENGDIRIWDSDDVKGIEFVSDFYEIELTKIGWEKVSKKTD